LRLDASYVAEFKRFTAAAARKSSALGVLFGKIFALVVLTLMHAGGSWQNPREDSQ
jgi:hypothetical protein